MTKMHSLMVVAAVGFLAFISGCSATDGSGGRTINLGGSGAEAEVGNAAGAAGLIVDPPISGIGGTITDGAGTVAEVVAGFDKGECAKTEVKITRNPINVILVVDRSTTMIMSRFGNYNTRWDALSAALMGDPDGLVRQYEQIVRFGYEGFTGFPGDTTGLTCPDLDSVPYETNNYDAIRPVFDASRPANLFAGAIGQTPTGESLRIIIDNLENQFISTPDVLGGGPFIFILATDGEPDTCAAPDPDGTPEATQLVVEQITRAFGLGIKTYVLSVGAEVSRPHLQAVANAGIGTDNAAYWTADNDQGLRDSLAQIIGEALPCQLELEGEIIDSVKACEEGVVMLNNAQLECSPTEGWRVVDSTHIELTGSACTTLKSSPAVILEASFPCGIYVV